MTDVRQDYILGSCLDNLETDEYDYFFSGTPCYEDLASFGVDKNKPITYKTKFLDWFVPRIRPKLGTVTIAFTGCRRANSQILPKFYYVNQAFFQYGYLLKDVKFYLKKTGYDGYSHTVGHVYTFQKKDQKGVFNLRKKKLFQTYGHDVWGPFDKEKVIDGEVVAQPIEIAQYCVENFTDEGHVVYDPFGGLGTTGLAAYRLGRGYLVYEIRDEIYQAGIERFNAG
jgi:hypothetical protein|tara:strand:- start:326 stop:1003 length:678 start_codon:yes stop_codon:yes gene_type:complete